MSQGMQSIPLQPQGSPADSQELFLADLRALIAKRQAVAVVGTGVSLHASGNNEVASWRGLLENAINRCVQLQLSTSDWAAKAREQLANEDPNELLSVADQIAALLGAPYGGEYRRWLGESVGSLRVQSPAILAALNSLGVLIVTTNYDSLIEEFTGLPVVTWNQKSEVEQVLRGDQKGILHLHGHWSQPESVILSSASYDSLRNDNHAEAILRSLRTTRSLVFIGYGSGLSDPNFGELLRWSRATFYGSEYRHYRLVSERRVREVQAQHPGEERIFAVSYGAHHDGLVPFIQGLAGATYRTDGWVEGRTGHETTPLNSRVWNVPRSRHPQFTGREDLLDELQNALNSRATSASPRVVAIHGLGGIGKTQLAVEYAGRNRSEYGVVWWIRAEVAETLASDFAELGYFLGLVSAEVSIHEAIAATRLWLEGTEDRWLLVLDNAKGLEEIREYIPGDGVGDVLITSRNAVWTPVARSLAVPVLDPSDSVAFLLLRTGQNDESAANELATELGWLPLALEQASAFIVARGLTLSRFIERFRAQRLEVLGRGKPADYEDTVATTWRLAFRELTEHEPISADLLKLFAYFAPDAIPLEILGMDNSLLPGNLHEIGSKPLLLDDAVVALRRYSLIEPLDDDTVSIHRLVQVVTRDQLQEQGDDQWLQTVVSILAAAFPSNGDDVRAWPFAARLMPHATSAIVFAQETSPNLTSQIELLSRMGMYLGGRAQFASARDARIRSLALAERAFGPDSPALAPYLNNLSLSLQSDWQMKEADAALSRARNLLESAEDADQILLATIIVNHGVVYRALGDVANARSCLEEGLALSEQVLGPDHPPEQVLGPDHPRVSIALNNLAALLVDLGETDRAIPMMERALKISVDSLGSNHPDVAVRLSGFASILAKEGDLDGACEVYSRVLAIDEAAYGHDHPEVADDLANLAGVKKEQGKLEEARQLLERAVAILSASTANPLKVDRHKLYLADVMQRMDMPDEASELIESVFTTYIDMKSVEPAKVAAAFQMLAEWHLVRGKLLDARRALQQALPQWRRAGDQGRVQATLHALRKIDEEVRAGGESRHKPPAASS